MRSRYGLKEQSTAPLGQRRVSRAGCLLLAVLVIGTQQGCSPETESITPAGAEVFDSSIYDPCLIHFDGGSPQTKFDDRGGDIVLEGGWVPQDSENGIGEAWVIGSQAEFSFPIRADRGRRELVVDCRPFTWPGAETQSVRLFINGVELGVRELVAGWQRLSFEVPSAVLELGLNRAKLTFAYATRPKDVGVNDDGRELSVCFRSIRIQPLGRETESSDTSVNAPENKLVLSGSGSVDLPLSPGASVTWDLEVMDAEGDDLEGIVSFHGSGGEREVLWSGPLESAMHRTIKATNNGTSCGFVSFQLKGEDAEAGQVAVRWSDDAIAVAKHSPSTDRPHVFVYLVDTVRADSLSVYGSNRPTSPRLLEFAQDAVVYDRAIAASSWTLPSVVSLLTGTYPDRHGVMQGNVKLSEESPVESISSILGRGGYETVGLSQSFVAGPEFGIDTGFDTYRMANRLNNFALRTAELRRGFVSWLEYEYDWKSPMFVYVHTVGPHAPYHPPERYRGYAREQPGALSRNDYLPANFKRRNHAKDPREIAHLRALYDGEVQYSDEQFGRFLDALKYFGLYDDSLIIFLSDHGEEFFDHGGFDHGRTLFQEVTRIPLLVKFPGSENVSGHRSSQLVSEVDVVPTILDVVGEPEMLSTLDGIPLPRIEKEGGRNLRPVYSEVNPVANEVYATVDYQAVWRGSLKCIENLIGTDRNGDPEDRLQAYNLDQDPEEYVPLDLTDPRVRECADILADWKQRSAAMMAPKDDESVTESAKDMLRELGYIE